MDKRQIYIEGMHCQACELAIGDTLREIKDLKVKKISHQNGQLEIVYYGRELPLTAVFERIKKLGYNPSLEPIAKDKRQKASFSHWLYALLIVFGFYLVYRYLVWIGLFSWLEIGSSSLNYGASFLTGVAASLSTCLVVVGAVVMSFSAKYQAQGNFFQSSLRPHLFFHVGRLASFFLLGGFLGLAGSWLGFSQTFNAIFTFLVALVLLYLSFNILGFLPSLASFGLKTPAKFLGFWHSLRDSNHFLAPALLGALTFFLPCGFTQSMQLLALSSGSFWTGGLSLFLFALGTVPVLLLLGISTRKIKDFRSSLWKKVIGILIFLFAFYTLFSALALAGLNIDFFRQKSIGQTVEQGDYQIINMVVDYRGFTPNVFYLKKGLPVKWLIDGQQVSGCTNEIIVPSLGLSQKISSGENVVEFLPDKAGTIAFSCGMGMVRGQFIVE
ncbi:MAG: sulfite exporter TauE/SafE family protein [Patescibacteria group bacterium]|nr:sulfite exporter TauE/SafE family protein [Patescibacteria group bacterium]